ncbi:MAG: hypothetical protein JRE40_12150 [Deltaproteobacteria bacterium]|nr:hypothetical protein [Deltaproteobacteria bacterium]
MSDYVIITKSEKVAKFAEIRGARVEYKNGKYYVYPLTNSEAHRIYNKFSLDCKIYHRKQIFLDDS